MPDTQTANARRLGTTKDRLGESPFWDTRTRTVCWIDSLTGDLHRLQPDTGALEAHTLPAPVGSMAPCDSGAVVLALRNSFARYDFGTRTLQTLAVIGVDHPDVRLNDGKCDPWGNFIAGTLHNNCPPEGPALGGLYRLRPDRSVECIAQDFAITNGPCFSPDGKVFYVADSLRRTVWAYDYRPDAPLGARRVFARTEVFGSGPDGATVDADGYLWTLLVRAGQLARFAPDGRLERRLQLPATLPTSLCFGGAGLDLAYITSISRSTHLVGPAEEDGGLFELRDLPATGLAPHRYADTL